MASVQTKWHLIWRLNDRPDYHELDMQERIERQDRREYKNLTPIKRRYKSQNHEQLGKTTPDQGWNVVLRLERIEICNILVNSHENKIFIKIWKHEEKWELSVWL